jgi:hypothetical protein
MTGSRPWRQATKPRITPDDAKFAEFTGVVNTRSRKDIGLKALYVGDNVVISDTKKVTRRDGYSPYISTGTVWAAYGGTGELYVVDNGVLQHVASPTDKRTLTSGLAHKPYTWDTINGDAYFANGVDAGITRGDEYLPWRLNVPAFSAVAAVSAASSDASLNMGEKYAQATFRVCATYETADGRETAPSEIVSLVAAPLTNLIRVSVAAGYARTNIYSTEADGTVFRLVASTTATTVTFNPARGGREFTTFNTASLPDGVTHVAFVGGRCFVGQYLQSLKQSVVWKSKAFAYHLFDTERDFITVAGELALLLWNNKGVLIGTDKNIYQWHEDTEELELLVNYGVMPGVAGDRDAESVAYFWTQRGICKAYPFENLTEKDVSMPPGARAVASMVYLNGMMQFVAVTQGSSTPFNKRKERT